MRVTFAARDRDLVARGLAGAFFLGLGFGLGFSSSSSSSPSPPSSSDSDASPSSSSSSSSDSSSSSVSSTSSSDLRRSAASLSARSARRPKVRRERPIYGNSSYVTMTADPAANPALTYRDGSGPSALYQNPRPRRAIRTNGGACHTVLARSDSDDGKCRRGSLLMHRTRKMLANNVAGLAVCN